MAAFGYDVSDSEVIRMMEWFIHTQEPWNVGMRQTLDKIKYGFDKGLGLTFSVTDMNHYMRARRAWEENPPESMDVTEWSPEDKGPLGPLTDYSSMRKDIREDINRELSE